MPAQKVLDCCAEYTKKPTLKNRTLYRRSLLECSKWCGVERKRVMAVDKKEMKKKVGEARAQDKLDRAEAKKAAKAASKNMPVNPPELTRSSNKADPDNYFGEIAKKLNARE